MFVDTSQPTLCHGSLAGSDKTISFANRTGIHSKGKVAAKHPHNHGVRLKP